MRKSLRKWIMAAVLAAIICVATMAITVPTPSGGYVNLGECVVMRAGWLLGPCFGFLAAGVGSALADGIAGYFVYVPGTLLIKGLMAVIAAAVASAFQQKRTAGRAVGAVLAELWMVTGYFLYEMVLSGWGGSIVGVPMNLLQGLVGAVAAVLVSLLLDKTGLLERYLKR